MDVPQSHVVQQLQLLANSALTAEEVERVFNREIEHVGNAPALVTHLQSFPIVPPSLAHLAGNIDIGQEVHLDLHQSVALTRLAPPALHVEGEAAGSISPHFCIRELREQLPDRREES